MANCGEKWLCKEYLIFCLVLRQRVQDRYGMCRSCSGGSKSGGFKQNKSVQMHVEPVADDKGLSGERYAESREFKVRSMQSNFVT